MAQFTVLLLVSLPLTSRSWNSKGRFNTLLYLRMRLRESSSYYYYIYAFSVDLDGVFQRQCVSCNLIDGCRFFKAEFSPNQTHFTLYCLGKSHPAFMPQNDNYFAVQTDFNSSAWKKNTGPGIPKVTVHYTKNPSSECFGCMSGWWYCLTHQINVEEHKVWLYFPETVCRRR